MSQTTLVHIADVLSKPSDPSPLSFSPEQQAIFAGWRRPAELMGLEGEDSGGLNKLMAAQEEMDLAQDLATDCSVVASLCGAARHFGPTKDSVSHLPPIPELSLTRLSR